MSMILTARRVSAAEGKDLGFVAEVTRPEELMATARAWARGICELGPMSIRASKQAVYRGLDEPSLEAAMKGQNQYPAIAALYRSEDFVEGPLAFSQKRAPQWKGR
jgi:crotonobetainyl-CoA hydratase